MIRKVFFKQPRGQSLVFVAVLSVALIGMLALALDFGYSMYNRRWAQNAADSAALAAARILCTDSDPLTRYTNATNEARSYAEIYNQVFGAITQTMTEICMYGDANNPAGCPTMDKGQAKVTVNIQHPTFVSGFFGTNSIDVPATATAGCFAPGGAIGSGVIPVAWKCDQINCNQQGECSCGGIEYIPDSANCTLGQDPLYVFFDKESSYYWCQEWEELIEEPLNSGIFYHEVNGTADLTSVVITCDIPNTARTIDITPISPLNPDHKWFYFSPTAAPGQGCGNKVTTVMEFGLEDPLYAHYWYPECPGTNDNAINVMERVRSDTQVIVPVFDRQCTIDNPLNSHVDDQYDCYAGVSAIDPNVDQKDEYDGTFNTTWYHLASFSLLDITCVASNALQDCDTATDARGWLTINNPSGQGNQSKITNEDSFEGCFVDGFLPGMFGRPSDGIDTGAWTLYLVK